MPAVLFFEGDSSGGRSMTLRAAAEQALDTLEHVQAHIGRYMTRPNW